MSNMGKYVVYNQLKPLSVTHNRGFHCEPRYVRLTHVTFQMGEPSTSVAPPESPRESDTYLNAGTLYVSNIPYDEREQEISDLFAKYGEVLKIIMQMRRDRFNGTAFVVMKSKEDAENAVKELNGTIHRDNKIIVEWSKKPYNPDYQHGRPRYDYDRPPRDSYRRDDRRDRRPPPPPMYDGRRRDSDDYDRDRPRYSRYNDRDREDRYDRDREDRYDRDRRSYDHDHERSRYGDSDYDSYRRRRYDDDRDSRRYEDDDRRYRSERRERHYDDHDRDRGYSRYNHYEDRNASPPPRYWGHDSESRYNDDEKWRRDERY